MALITCPDCGREVSKRAPACQNCGAPIKTKGMGPVGIIAGVLFTASVIGMVVQSINEPTPSHTAASAPRPALPPIDKSQEMQVDRERLIRSLQNGGLIGDVECRHSGADMWVQPTFMLLDIKDKERFASVAYAYCFDSVDAGVVQLKGTLDGKTVGRYNPASKPALAMH